MTSSYLQQASQHSPIMVAMSTDRPNEALRWLKERLATISDVNTARNVLHWDRQTYMPEGGIYSRAEQVATLSRLVHEMLVSRETAELMAALDRPEPGSEDFAFVRLARREYERTAKLPNRLVEELARATALAQPAWEQARARSDWTSFEPHLGKILLLQRESTQCFGYDWKRGRLDRVVHPFCISLGGPGDVRITTRFDSDHLSPALFGTFHEAGHAIYEQGIDPAYSRSPLSGGTSMGVHESQSRLWENLVGRSRTFWSFYYPSLRETFREALGDTDLDTFYRAINEVKPSEIRVEADELTYNLHILLRFELEISLIEEDLAVAELPAAWNAKMEEYLGVTPEDETNGVLQDVHWAAGLFGYFPTYTIGNVLAAQLLEEALRAHPEIPEQMGDGEFGTLRGWLWENIYRHGSRYDPDELIEMATDRPLETAPYL